MLTEYVLFDEGEINEKASIRKDPLEVGGGAIRVPNIADALFRILNAVDSQTLLKKLLDAV